MNSFRRIRITATGIEPLDGYGVAGLLLSLCQRLPEGDWGCECLTPVEAARRLRYRHVEEAYLYIGTTLTLCWWAEPLRPGLLARY